MADAPMIAPDGTPGFIPADKVQAATSAGFKRGVSLWTQDGKNGIIPLDRAKDALKSGLMASKPSPQYSKTLPASERGQVSAPKPASGQAMDVFSGMATMPAQLLAPPKPGTEQSIVSAVPEVGMPLVAAKRAVIDPMQAEAEKARSTTGVESFGHGLASVLPVVGPMAAGAGEAFAHGEGVSGALQTMLTLGTGVEGARTGVEAARQHIQQNIPKYETKIGELGTKIGRPNTESINSLVDRGLPRTEYGKGLRDVKAGSTMDKVETQVVSDLDKTGKQMQHEVDKYTQRGFTVDVKAGVLDYADQAIASAQREFGGDPKTAAALKEFRDKYLYKKGPGGQLVPKDFSAITPHDLFEIEKAMGKIAYDNPVVSERIGPTVRAIRHNMMDGLKTNITGMTELATDYGNLQEMREGVKQQLSKAASGQTGSGNDPHTVGKVSMGATGPGMHGLSYVPASMFTQWLKTPYRSTRIAMLRGMMDWAREGAPKTQTPGAFPTSGQAPPTPPVTPPGGGPNISAGPGRPPISPQASTGPARPGAPNPIPASPTGGPNIQGGGGLSQGMPQWPVKGAGTTTPGSPGTAAPNPISSVVAPPVEPPFNLQDAMGKFYNEVGRMPTQIERSKMLMVNDWTGVNGMIERTAAKEKGQSPSAGVTGKTTSSPAASGAAPSAEKPINAGPKSATNAPQSAPAPKAASGTTAPPKVADTAFVRQAREQLGSVASMRQIIERANKLEAESKAPKKVVHEEPSTVAGKRTEAGKNRDAERVSAVRQKTQAELKQESDVKSAEGQQDQQLIAHEQAMTELREAHPRIYKLVMKELTNKASKNQLAQIYQLPTTTADIKAEIVHSLADEFKDKYPQHVGK